MNLKLLKALRLLDAGRLERAEQVLLELFASSDQGSHTYLTTSLILGELCLKQQELERARDYLEIIAKAQLDDDVLADEQLRARTLLTQLERGEFR